MSVYSDDSDITVREKFGRFRILIVGRADAGKTTILQRICNATEAPEIFDDQGNKIDPLHVEASLDRGVHNIEHDHGTGVFSMAPRVDDAAEFPGDVAVERGARRLLLGL